MKENDLSVSREKKERAIIPIKMVYDVALLVIRETNVKIKEVFGEERKRGQRQTQNRTHSSSFEVFF